MLADTGERTTGRGRVGSYYALAEQVGCALAVSVAPEGVVAEVVDPGGRVLMRGDAAVSRPARPQQVASAVRLVGREVAGQASSPVRLAMVSAADPVDRASGRLVHLPGAPFLVGEVSPADLLAEVVHGPVVVDNDVNWAARAEGDAAGKTGQSWTDVVYLYLGEGVGGAIISDGEVRRGGIMLGALARAIGGVLSSVVALCDPELVVLGGPWGGRAEVVDAVRAAAIGLRRPVEVRAAVVTEHAPLSGARTAAIRALGDLIVDYRRTLAPKPGGHWG